MRVLITGNAAVDRVLVRGAIRLDAMATRAKNQAKSLRALSGRLRARCSQATYSARERLRRLKRAAGRIGGRVF